MTSINEVKETLDRWYHIEDTQVVDALLSFMVSHRLQGDPVWLFLIGQSSALKTELLHALETKDTVCIDKITPKTLISGRPLKPKARMEVDLAPQLRNKVWLISDFSQVLTVHKDQRSEIFSDLRSLYDGRIHKIFGTGVNIIYGSGSPGDPKIKCSLLAATTPTIDQFTSEISLLGSRHLMIRTNGADDQEIMEKIEGNLFREDKARKECRKAVSSYLSNLKLGKVDISEEVIENLQAIVKTTVRMKAAVQTDRYTDEVTEISYPEGPGRIYKMLRKMLEAGTHILDEETALNICKRIAEDCGTQKRAKIYQMFKGNDEPLYISKIARELRIGKRTVRRELNSMWQLKLIRPEVDQYDEDGGDNRYWRLWNTPV